MEEPLPAATNGVARLTASGESSSGSGPIRKQSPEERRAYMREYMRAYRLQHPGLSTPYVRSFRARRRSEAT
jgi:hypothetical protein